MRRLVAGYRWFWTRDATWFAVASLVLGLGLLFWGAGIGIGNVAYLPCEDCGFKQVGYYTALNWSVGLSLGLAAVIFFGVNSLGECFRALENLRKNDVLVVVDQEKYEQRVFDFWRQAMILGAIAILVTACGVWFDYSTSVGAVYAAIPAGATEPPLLETLNKLEIDWSVIGALPPSMLEPGYAALAPTRGENVAFTIAAYAVLFVNFAFVIVYYMNMFMLSRFFRGVALDDNFGAYFRPSLQSTDRRMGFEAFQPFIFRAMITTFAGYVLLYLLRLQNSYLAERQAPNLTTFLFRDVASQASELNGNTFAVIGGLLIDVGQSGGTFTEILAILVTFIAFGIVVNLVINLLQRTAEDARDKTLAMLRAASDGDRALNGHTKEEALKRVSEMSVWPMSWPSQRVFLGTLVVGVIFFIFFRLGILYIFLMIVALFMKWAPKAAAPARVAGGN